MIYSSNPANRRVTSRHEVIGVGAKLGSDAVNFRHIGFVVSCYGTPPSVHRVQGEARARPQSPVPRTNPGWRLQ
jgi:hypothetical protein